MKTFKMALGYFKRHVILSVSVFISIILASIFDGASFGMMIPLIQGMTSQNGDIFGSLPIFRKLSFLLPASSDRVGAVSMIFILMFVLLIGKNIFAYFASIMTAALRFVTTRDARTGLMKNVLRYDLKFFDNAKTGHLINSISEETVRIGIFMNAMMQYFVLLGKIMAYFALLLVISFSATIIIVLLIVVVMLPLELIMKRLKKIGDQLSDAANDYNFKLTETLNGIRLIKSMSMEENETARFSEVAEKVRAVQYRLNRYISMLVPLAEVVIFGVIMVYFIVFMRSGNIDLSGTFPFVATYLLVLTRMLTQLNVLNSRRSEVVSNIAALERYDNLCDPEGKETIKGGTVVIREFMSGLEFKNVTFSYQQGSPVLKNINLKVPKGGITALVGISGSGKSTLANLVPRFYDPDSGAVYVDGIDLKKLDMSEWRRTLGVISQDTFIFNASVRDNIAYGCHNVSEEDIIKSAKAANAHEFVAQMKDGYGTIIGERGVKLSGGQKQRLSIARAIIHNPRILIMDEATSALDTHTERLITEALDRLTKNRTVIAIAHRLSTILHADNIVVLENGTVVEEGTHRDLLERNGAYKRLYDTQFKHMDHCKNS